MSRKALLHGSVLLFVACLGVGTWLRGDFITPSSFIFRSEEELLSLRNLLGDPAAWSELESLSERMALWRLETVTELAPPGESCLPVSGPGEAGEWIHHQFDFASRRSVSSRVFRTEFISCKEAQGRYRVRRERFGYRSIDRPVEEPCLEGSTPLKVLRLAVSDAGVSSDIVSALRENSIGYCRVQPEGDGPQPGISVYRFIAADSPSEERVRLEYLVEYDEARDVATFTRL